MKKKIKNYIKLQITSGKATPAPPIGPALGQHGLNIMSFCKEFNARTKNKNNMIVPVLVTIYDDKSFSFIVKSPPTSILLKKAAGLSIEKKPGSGSKKPGKENVGKLTKKQIMEIGKIKLLDLNCINEKKIFKTILGTAKSIGINVID